MCYSTLKFPNHFSKHKEEQLKCVLEVNIKKRHKKIEPHNKNLEKIREDGQENTRTKGERMKSTNTLGECINYHMSEYSRKNFI